jgi:hypothetical protein
MRRLTFLVTVIGLAQLANADEAAKFRVLDLKPYCNQKRGDNMESNFDGNNLAKLPGGEQTFGGVSFQIEQGIIQLGSTVLETQPEKVAGIKVERKCARLHILHATQYGGGPNKEGNPWFVKDGTMIGEYCVTYEDKSSVNIPIVYGEDVRDWFFVGGEMETVRSKIVWKGENEWSTAVGAKIRLYLTTWKNPMPDKKVLSIDYVSKKAETVAAPFCVAMSLED